jgi:pantothenate kinase
MDAVIDELTARLAAAAFYGDGDGDARVFVGIAGSPGSGKSTLASAVRDKLNAAAGDDVAVVFPMDGFHYYRSQLADPAMFPDPVAARARRGAPWTFDARAFVDRVRAARTNTDSSTSVPAFDHQVHDPEEDAITILPSHKVILVEGNYLLLPDEPWRELWDGAGALLDERWFVDTAVDDAMTRVMGRHVAVGRSAEEAKSRADGNDRLNGEMVWAARGNADVHVPSYEWEGA